MTIDIVTIFPDFFKPFVETSMIRKAQEKGYVTIRLHDLRDYSKDRHRKVDDTPYGGGAGMVLTFQPLYDAIMDLKSEKSRVILLTPQGRLFDQRQATELAGLEHVILIAGHYEGFDARIEDYVDLELSIGNFVLTGGEIPAMAVADAIIRLVPGVLHEESATTDSLQQGLLKHPQYTKPASYLGHDVPDVLLSGNHGLIEAWRKRKSVERTLKKRPDLLKDFAFDDAIVALIEEVKKSCK
ncbi:MAG: tRNA (guanosine(37)-N1)-methyltransferase TrmD [Acholeplasmataceae bacterium]